MKYYLYCHLKKLSPKITSLCEKTRNILQISDAQRAQRFLLCDLTFDNMASKGLRAMSYQVTRKVEAGYKLSHTTETLLAILLAPRVLFFINHFLEISCQFKNSEWKFPFNFNFFFIVQQIKLF